MYGDCVIRPNRDWIGKLLTVDVFATETTECFSIRYIGENFGMIMFGYGAAATVFPYIFTAFDGNDSMMPLIISVSHAWSRSSFFSC